MGCRFVAAMLVAACALVANARVDAEQTLPLSGAPAVTDGYAVRGALQSADAPAGALVTFYGRHPAPSEMEPFPQADAVFFFHFTVSPAQPIAISRGTLDVRVPFALNPRYNYVVTLANCVPNIIDLRGTLRDNALHFDLPAFSIPAGTRVMGEVDGNDWGTDFKGTRFFWLSWVLQKFAYWPRQSKPM